MTPLRTVSLRAPSLVSLRAKRSNLVSSLRAGSCEAIPLLKFLYLNIALFIFLITLILFSNPQSAIAQDTLEKIKSSGEIVWGSDAEGGAPYIFPDPENPSRLIGFEVDLMDAIARELGIKQRQFQNSWDSLIPTLERGDIDIAINGIEITPARKEKVAFSNPYYIYTEQLVVRAKEERVKEASDLKGKKVGTLSGSAAQGILEGIGSVDIKIYSGQVEPYKDLSIGRLDAVLLDLPIAAYYAKPNPLLKFTGAPIGEGYYGIAMRKGDDRLKEEINKILERLFKSGEIKNIYEKWGLWNSSQERLISGFGIRDSGFKEPQFLPSESLRVLSFLPFLLKGALMTIIISVLSMILAVFLGLILVILRLYGSRILSILSTAYIEIYRGTPLLIQLYILYYGLPNIGITLNAFTAAVIGLGMNYAAYEAEIYRAGIEAIPKGQMEAALSLGMRRSLALQRIILPQAVKIAIPPVTNDFIALFKDSSLVSVIAMVELTKSYSILAVSSMKFFELGLITALLYFGMSYPLSLFARRLERRLKRGLS
ncbi:MAG: ABC transporter permease subunit [Nitrospinae bacterium]|nr:ABC transporter permease subunit [Nitrospinota bacterium]MBI3814093.1 ABC transporter permease subunit [Nitrospinota bacterium]